MLASQVLSIRLQRVPPCVMKASKVLQVTRMEENVTLRASYERKDVWDIEIR